MQFSENRLVLDSGSVVTFNYKVSEVLEFGDTAVVLLETSGTKSPLPGVVADVTTTKGSNVFGISKADGRVLWQIVPVVISPFTPVQDSPYVGMRHAEDGSLHATSWEGVTLVLDPVTGKEVRKRTWAK